MASSVALFDLAGILLVLPAPLIALLDSSLVDSTRNLLVYDCGLFAYACWLAIVVLSTWPRWLDRLIGLPALYFVHGAVGILALALASTHVLLAFSMHPVISNTGHIAWYLAIFGAVYAVLFLSGWLVDRSAVALKLKRWLERVFHHQLSVWIHRLNLVVIALIFLHVHVIPRISVLTPFMLTFDAYTLLAALAYAWSKFVTPASERRSGRVLENLAVEPRVRQITFELGPQAPDPHPGDFYFVSFPATTGLSAEAHPFSLTNASEGSTPEGGKASRAAIFTIQTTGDYTRQLKKVQAGDQARLEGPFGRFDSEISSYPSTEPLVFIGMGTGLSPLMSLALHYGSKRSIHLLWSVREGEESMFERQLQELADVNPQISVDFRHHRFSPEDYRKLLTQTELMHALFVVVGQAVVVVQTERILHQLGVEHSRLVDERLTM
ncbi:hypothetical protein KIM372_04210 [Bombiscardovia nodaiensis]|uniref:FAD-binding FR-type domain-containing protein n=1 Tax=Bombiscardovia nodaiensis TaxID=2932181 RepID=A0ABM8B6Q1_9BIFI|nr:hypothetical protein KIM372_04210 [Bombiscardovia nodaiensis]